MEPVTRIRDAGDALAGGQAIGPIPLWMFQRLEAAADDGGHPLAAGVEEIGVGHVVPVFREGVEFVHPGPVGFGEAGLDSGDVLGGRGVADVETVGPFERGVVRDLVDLFLVGDALAFEPGAGEEVVALDG